MKKKLAKYLADYLGYEHDENNVPVFHEDYLEQFIKQGLDAFESVKMKHYIFLTVDGSTLDGAGNEIENVQVLAEACGETALDAYNIALDEGVFQGDFDTCFCYELANEGKVQGRFDLITD